MVGSIASGPSPNPWEEGLERLALPSTTRSTPEQDDSDDDDDGWSPRMSTNGRYENTSSSVDREGEGKD